jgi:hypothetical protein
VPFSVLLTLGLPVSVLYVDDAQLVPALHSYWLWIHVSAAIIICGGMFHTAAVVTALYLVRDRRETAVAGRGEGRPATVWCRLPSAQSLDKLSYRLTALAVGCGGSCQDPGVLKPPRGILGDFRGSHSSLGSPANGKRRWKRWRHGQPAVAPSAGRAAS